MESFSSLREFREAGALKRVQSFADGTPKHLAIDIRVIVPKYTTELPELLKFHFWIFEIKDVAEFSRCFANPLQASLDRILSLLVDSARPWSNYPSCKSGFVRCCRECRAGAVWDR